MTLSSNILPFEITLNSSTEKNLIQCERLLRDLPGKRLVCKGLWQQRPVVVKVFLDHKSAHRHWGREKDGAEALNAAPVATPELLFSGHLVDGTPVLVFDFLPSAKTALENWNNLSTVESKADFSSQLIEMIGNLHDAGLEQEDLHLENFLVSGGRLYAIDGDAICTRHKGKPLELKSSSRNLSLFFAQLPPKYDSLIEILTQRYAMQRNMSASQLLNQVWLDLPKIRRLRCQKYVKKSYRSCSEFVRSQHKGQVEIFRRDMQGETLRQFLDDPDAFMLRGEILKDGNTATVVRVQLDGCDWVIKRYNIKNPLHALRRSIQPTRAWTSWGNAHRLKISGILTPRAIAVIEKRIGPLRSTGYFLCDYVEGTNAEDFFQDDKIDAFVKEHVASNFVNLFELFSRLNISHGDCKATNFLLNDHELWVLDLDSMQDCVSTRRFRQLFKADRERFLRNWLAMPELKQWFDERLPGKG